MSLPLCAYCSLRVPNPCETSCEERACFGKALLSSQNKRELDAVEQPAHYARWKMQPIEFIAANDFPFWLANLIKYGCRYDAKDGLQDLYKARSYLDMQIKKLEGHVR